jgi:protein-S-isoprenylcysteine O-methyltransferase Ste14
MRNPIRFKNANLRYLPWYVLGALALLWSRPDALSFECGSGVVIVGLMLRSWGAGHLVKNASLTVTGPYQYIRHPLYAGTLLIGVGFAVIAGGWLSIALLPFLGLWFFLSYFPRKEKSESARLEELYGEALASYRAAVPALIPGRRPGAGFASSEVHRWEFARYSENNELGTLIAVVFALVIFGVRTGMAA